MEHREPHGWYAGLDLYHKQLSTHAQQIIRAIRSEHTRRMQNSGDHKCYQWNLEMEELSTDRQNVRKVAEFHEVGYWNDMEREEANFVDFQPGNVTRQKIDIARTEAYADNQTERHCTDRLDDTFLTSDRSAQSLPVTSYHLPVGSEMVNTIPKAPFSIKELHVTETQKTDLGSQSEHAPVQLVNDLAANESPEDWSNFQFHGRRCGVAVCRDQADSVQQHGTLAQQGPLVNQYLGLPGLNKTLISSTGRLSSVQEEKKDNCLKRKREKPANKSTPKQALLDGRVKEHHDPTTKGLDSTELRARPQICDLISLNSDQRPQVLEEVARAAGITLTMVYQDGSTQLTAEKEPSSSVSGFLVLLSNQPAVLLPDTTAETQTSEHIVYTADADGRFFHLKLEPNLSWLQRGHGYREFSRALLLQIINHKGCVVAFKAKDLLQTVLNYAADTLCWKQASSWKIFDPRIAGWLLEPTDTSPCFKTLVLKHCGASSALELTPSNTHCTGNSKLQELCVGLHILHRLMMHVWAKLQSQHLWKLFCLVELRLIPVLAVMENYRIRVNKEDLKRTSELLGVRQKQLEQEAHLVAGEQFLLTSSNQLRQILYDKLRLHLLCGKKIRKTDLKQQQSTSEAVLLQLQEFHPLPKIILEYRQIHKIKSTYIDGLLSCMRKGFVSPTWNQTGTVSGRLSAKHPNIQAIPKQPVQISKLQYIRGREADMISISPRSMFLSSDGWTFLAADFSHIELRILAHLTSDPELLRLFQEPEPPDIFTSLASQWKGIPLDQVKNAEREQAKRIVYALVYGAGKDRLSEHLGVSASQAGQFIESFLQKYKEVRTFTQRTIQQCHQEGHVVSIMGRKRSFPLISSQDYCARNQAERQAVNFVVQGSAADICKMAMIKIFTRVATSSSLTARLVAQIHDELLFQVEDSQIQQVAELVKGTMESLRSVEALGVYLKVPLKVSLSAGKSWGSMKEL